MSRCCWWIAWSIFSTSTSIWRCGSESCRIRAWSRPGSVVCGSPAYLAAHGIPVHPSELASHEAVTFAGLSSAKAWPFRIATSTEMFSVRSRFTVTTAEAALDAAIAGAGITRVLSYQAAAAVLDGRLVLLLRDYEVAPNPVSLVYPSGRLVPLKLRAFLDFAVPRLKARLQSIAAIESQGADRGA
jgi:DNA-binding transcriptional LysR family regulator